ncbi:MAG: hypothetical protein HY291_00080 [Planctomycetes bacterium]|nr:hypothetical protein [Planctomycetota bacterium]
MSFRRFLTCAFLMLGSAGPLFAGAAKPELPPSPLDEMSAEDALRDGKFFEKYQRDSQKGVTKFDKQGNMIGDVNKVALCPACHQPLYLHSDPGFKCVPQGPRLPGPDARYAQPLEVHKVETHCPVCKAKFVAAYQGNINSLAGMDRDFCRHSVGADYAVNASVWLCPECGYAGFADRLNEKGQVVPLWGKELDGSELTPKTLELVNTRLKAFTFDKMIEFAGLRKEAVLAGTPEAEKFRKFGDYLEQTQIPDWVKYKNALFLMENNGIVLPHALRARLYLEAGWACRREVCSEIGITGLVPQFQVLLGKSIRLMNRYINSECLNIRQRRREGFVDPGKPETDPAVLAEACANIIKYGEMVVHDEEQKAKAGQPPPPQDQARFQVGDIFVLRLRQAGFLDRCGKINEAAETLEKARAVIPMVDEVKQVLEELKPELAAKGIKDDFVLKSIDMNLQMLQHAVDVRSECLKMEREYLFHSAEHLMQALFFNENPNNKDLATSVYWAAELYRRDGRELEVAKACFETANKLIKKQDVDGKRAKLDDLVKQRKDPTKPSEAEAAVQAEIARLDTLNGWSDESLDAIAKAVKARELSEQKAGIQPTPAAPLRENIAKALAEIEKRAGAASIAATPVQRPPEGPKTPEPAVKTEREPANEGKTVADTAPKNPEPRIASVVKTRADLYRVYYEALTRYVKDKKANPESLSELVSTGYLKQVEACLDENGVLICPETQQKLLYSKGAPFGEKAQVYIFPRAKDPNQTKLYGDGHVSQ